MASVRRQTDNTKVIEEIGEVLDDSQDGLVAFRTAIANKHVIIFLGNTRSGKSTLVNYVMGTKLIAFEERRPIFKIKKADEQAEGPAIGQGSQSCTSIPSVYPLNQFGMVIVDAPGFDDNRGEAQDIVNALYINQIKYAKTVKFVLVSDLNDLVMDNIKGFTDLIDKVYALFPNFENLKNSVSIVFTKDFRGNSPADIAVLLKLKIVEVDGLLINKQLISHFIENINLIALFRMPTRIGTVTNEIDVNIENARLASCASLLNDTNIKVTLSSKSRLVLLKIYQRYLDSAYFEVELKRIYSRFAEYFKVNDYVFASTDDELNDVKQNLKNILNLFTSEAEKSMFTLCEVHNSLSRTINVNMSQKFNKTFRILLMIDNNSLMEDAIRTKFITKYKESLKGIMHEIEMLLSKIVEEIEDRKKCRQVFNASAGLARAAGGTAVVGEVLHRVFSAGSRLGSPFGILGIAGAVITSIGAGAAATSVVVQKNTEKKRIQARERQGRSVSDDMFSDS